MSEQQWEGSPSPEAPEFQFDIRDHLQLLRKRLWLIAAVAVVAVGLGATYALLAAPVYRASGTLHIDTATPRVLGDVKEVVELGAGDYWSSKEFLETQYKILTSRDVLGRVVEKLGLDRDLEFLGLAEIRDVEERNELLAKTDPVEVLEERVRVEPVKNSQLVGVAVEDTDPARAAELANAIMDAYVARNLDRRLEGTRSASDWLSEQTQDLKGKLEASELALYDFKKDQDILSTSLEDRQNIISQRLVSLNDSLTRALGRKVELEAALAEAEQARKLRPDDPFWPASLAKVAGLKLMDDLRLELSKVENEVAAAREQYLEKHPKRAAAEERLASVKQRIADEMATVVRSIESEYREALGTEKRLTALIEGVKREAFELNKKEIDYKKLKREEENNQRLYEMVLSRLKEADLTALLKANNVRKLEAAQVPQLPVKPRKAIVLLLSLLLGLGAGVGLAYLLEVLDSTLKHEEDVERVLGVPFLGMLPTAGEEGAKKAKPDRSDDPTRDLFILHHPKSAVAECARAIRTNLLFMSPDRELKRFLVTSSGPQEGKTTTAIHTAIVMAQAGSRVLIVDTDMRKPRVHRAFGVGNDVGISSLIVGEARFEDAIKGTQVPGLDVLPCGPIPPNPAELLHTERFREVLAQLSERYDRVVFDTPPLMPVADAAVLATQVDGVLLVTRFKKTGREMALRALRSLKDVNATVLGAVMNDVDLESREYDYYYSRRYGDYSSYYGEDEGKGSKAA